MAAMSASLETLNVGDLFLSKYQIRGLIGRGGQATVYHGYDTFIDRDVAIKVMTDAFDSKREHSRRAQMEARVLCKLHHANIVHVYDAGATEGGTIYIIMELLRGRTLREVLRDVRQLTIFEALSLGAQVADGVDIAHHKQVIHRDLKPENIFVVDGNTIKVLDFGIAKFLTLTGITTQNDTLHGTMWYISPEHVQGQGVTARSDIYALGSILYEAVSGTPPCLVGLEEISTPAVAWSQISRIPPLLNELVVGVPSHVGLLIQRMLAKDPSDRPTSMSEVAAALRAACSQLDGDPSRPLTESRNLWHETQIRAVSPSKTLVGQGFEIPPSNSSAPNAFQPVIEVRESRDSPGSNSGVGASARVVESGIVVASQAPAFTTPHVPARTVVTDVPASDEPKQDQPANNPVVLNRRVLLLVAVTIGIFLGLGIGFSGRLSSKADGARKSTGASATPAPAVTFGQPSVVSNTPVVPVPSTPVTNEQAATAASVSTGAQPSSMTNAQASATAAATSIGSPPVVRKPKKGTSNTTPQPRYSGVDLE